MVQVVLLVVLVVGLCPVALRNAFVQVLVLILGCLPERLVLLIRQHLVWHELWTKKARKVEPRRIKIKGKAPKGKVQKGKGSEEGEAGRSGEVQNNKKRIDGNNSL